MPPLGSQGESLMSFAAGCICPLSARFGMQHALSLQQHLASLLLTQQRRDKARHRSGRDKIFTASTAYITASATPGSTPHPATIITTTSSTHTPHNHNRQCRR